MVAAVIVCRAEPIETSTWSRLKRSTKSWVSSTSCSTSTDHASCMPKEYMAPPPCSWQQPHEMQALAQLQSRLRLSPQGCPQEDTLKWFLRDSCFNVGAAEAKLKSMLEWRAVHGMTNLTLDTVRDEYETGKAYLHCHLDAFDRPAVVIRARHHHLGQFPMEDSKRLCTFMIDAALARLVPGGSEQILWVIDLAGISVCNIDLMFMAFVLGMVQDYFPRRVGQVLFVDAPWIFKAPWETFKPLLKKFAALVRFVSRKQLAAEYFTPGTLPEGFRS